MSTHHGMEEHLAVRLFGWVCDSELFLRQAGQHHFDCRKSKSFQKQQTASNQSADATKSHEQELIFCEGTNSYIQRASNELSIHVGKDSTSRN